MIVVCGEALIDLVPAGGAFHAHPGGSPANVAVGLGRLGVDVSLLARLAGDQFGRLLRDHLSASKVGLDLIARSAEPTTLAVVSLGAADAAVYDFYIEGCADGGWSVGGLPADLPAGAALHFSGSLALPVESMAAAFEALLLRERPRRVITFDPNVRPLLIRDPDAIRVRLTRWLGLADIVKVSAEDLGWVAPGRPVEAVAREWREMGPSVVVVTRGGEGVHAVGPAGAVDLPAEPIKIVDTVGAGDSFMSGLLAALHDANRLHRPRLTTLTTAELTAALSYAARVAAITCGRAGADPPWRHELSAAEDPGGAAPSLGSPPAPSLGSPPGASLGSQPQGAERRYP
jgi:fructokinase